MKHIAIKLRKFEAYLQAEQENYIQNGIGRFDREANTIADIKKDFQTFFEEELRGE